MSDSPDEYSDLELDEQELLLLDGDLERPPSRGALVYSSGAYCASYKHSLALATRKATGIDPYPWQLDCSLASHLGRNVFLLAGTGSGKTLAFMMNCFLDSSLTIWLISPLNVLGNQQAIAVPLSVTVRLSPRWCLTGNGSQMFLYIIIHDCSSNTPLTFCIAACEMLARALTDQI
jgi:hypothetical protein